MRIKKGDTVKIMQGKEKGEIKAKLHEAKIPDAIIKELMPEEAPAAGGAPGAKPAPGAAAPKADAKKDAKK